MRPASGIGTLVPHFVMPNALAADDIVSGKAKVDHRIRLNRTLSPGPLDPVVCGGGHDETLSATIGMKQAAHIGTEPLADSRALSSGSIFRVALHPMQRAVMVGPFAMISALSGVLQTEGARPHPRCGTGGGRHSPGRSGEQGEIVDEGVAASVA
jgi:hypothetical protein